MKFKKHSVRDILTDLYSLKAFMCINYVYKYLPF